MKIKLNAAILGMLAVLMLAACSKDEPDTPTPPEPPKGQRLIKSATSIEGGKTYRTDFYYQNGRIKRAEWSALDRDPIEFQTTHYSFEGNKININYDDGTKPTAVLNDQGYVSYVTDDKKSPTNFTYSDNLMTSQGTINLWSANYTWNNGNMVASRIKFNGGQSSTTYTYGNIANNPLCNLDMNFANPISEELFVEDGLAVFGYCGLRSKKLISSIAVKGNHRVDITYTLDKDGFVTKIIYTNTGDNSTDTYEIEYY